jgi:adenylylsulfate kinase
MDSNSRSLAKAFSYRILGSLATGVIVFAVTGKPGLSAGAGAADMILKIGLYFLHERIWNYIRFGREKAPEYEI